MYKLVDDFNGHHHSNHRTISAAVEAREKWHAQFKRANPGADFCGAIVPASAEWKYIGQQGFAWSENLSESELEEIQIELDQIYS